MIHFFFQDSLKNKKLKGTASIYLSVLSVCRLSIYLSSIQFVISSRERSLTLFPFLTTLRGFDEEKYISSSVSLT